MCFGEVFSTKILSLELPGVQLTPKRRADRTLASLEIITEAHHLSYTTTPSMSSNDENSDPFDSILSLEDSFYKEGYVLGEADGRRAGLLDGRLFGLEKGFEKYACMGKLHGRAMVWAGKIATDCQDAQAVSEIGAPNQDIETSSDGTSLAKDPHPTTMVRKTKPGRVDLLKLKPRLENHVRTLYALTEPESLSTKNSKDAVADFDDRLRRAQGKSKLIEKLTGEVGPDSDVTEKASDSKSDGNIEDLSSLHIRH